MRMGTVEDQRESRALGELQGAGGKGGIVIWLRVCNTGKYDRFEDNCWHTGLRWINWRDTPCVGKSVIKEKKGELHRRRQCGGSVTLQLRTCSKRVLAEALIWDWMGPWPWILSHNCDHLWVPSSSLADLLNFLFLLQLWFAALIVEYEAIRVTREKKRGKSTMSCEKGCTKALACREWDGHLGWSWVDMAMKLRFSVDR